MPIAMSAQPDPSAVVEAALEYAARGKPVFPCAPDKRPLTPHGFQDATTDATTIREWWRRWPGALIGMPTGRASRIVVIDCDVGNGIDGAEAYESLAAPYGGIEHTVMALTPSGGLHFYLEAPEQEVRNSASRLALGVDVRGEGGYVIVPPSRLPDGRCYEWEASNPPKPGPMPAWLLRMAGTHIRPEPVATPVDGKVVSGQRNAYLASYAGRMARAGFSRQQIREAVRAENARVCNPPLTQYELERTIDKSTDTWVRRAAEDGVRPVGVPEGGENDASTWPNAIDLTVLSTRDPKEPEFIVEDWLPVGYATLLAGHGGVGKSGIALYLAVCNALGLDFFGLRVKARRVLYLSCEDREEVLHWRLSRICAHLGIELSQLSGKLDILDLVGRETILWERDPRTGETETEAARELRARIARDGIEVLYVDGVSDTYGGNENARPEVKRFVNMLVGMVPPDTGAVVMIGHVAKPAAHASSTSEGYSGSTGWHNSVRARWYLYPETRAGEDGERSEKTGDLLLELQKSNLGPTDQAIRFEWNTDGKLFVGRGVIGESALDRQNRDRSERRGILAALASAEAAGIYVPAASMGQRTAYHVLSVQPDFPDSLLSGTPGRRRFWRHLEALRAMRDVVEFTYTREDRHKVAAIRSNGAGCGHAGNAN